MFTITDPAVLDETLCDLFALDDNPGGEVVVLDAGGRAWIIAPSMDTDEWFAQCSPREGEDLDQLSPCELLLPLRVLSPEVCRVCGSPEGDPCSDCRAEADR